MTTRPVMVTVSRRTWRSLVALTAMGLLLGAASILWSTTYVNISHGEIVAQASAERAAQQRQGALVESKLCATLGPLAGLALLRPPAGNPTDNPSRAFEQQLVVKLAPLAQLGPDLGCGKKGTR